MRLILSFILCLLITSPLFATLSFANDYEAGKQAYDEGDYETAYEIWLPLAEAGDVDAQGGVALIFMDKKPYSLHMKYVAKWIFIASTNGHKKANKILNSWNDPSSWHDLEITDEHRDLIKGEIKIGIELGKNWLAKN